MAIQPPKPGRLSRQQSSRKQTERRLCDRDRLLAALESAPRLSKEEAERIDRIIREAREASLADDLPA
jgi:hypothetical protein